MINKHFKQLPKQHYGTPEWRLPDLKFWVVVRRAFKESICFLFTSRLLFMFIMSPFYMFIMYNVLFSSLSDEIDEILDEPGTLAFSEKSVLQLSCITSLGLFAAFIILIAILSMWGYWSPREWTLPWVRDRKKVTTPEWEGATTPWELTVTSTGTRFYLTMAVRAIAYNLPVEIDFKTETSRIDLPGGTHLSQVIDLLAAIDPIPPSMLGGDIKDILRLVSEHKLSVHYYTMNDEIRDELIIPEHFTDETRARKDLDEFLGQDLRLTGTELLGLGYLTWATPIQIRRDIELHKLRERRRQQEEEDRARALEIQKQALEHPGTRTRY